MTFTSVLNDNMNPFPGKIFTSPADTTDGDWAQYGCFEHVDYTGFNQITKDVFLGVISGDQERVRKATGIENPKVLHAGPDDTVFSYYIDHGTVEAISVGWDYVQHYQLVEAIKTAYDKKLYGKWFWLFEACYSGSMFHDLPSDINFYVVTSADRHHEAYMSNCPPDDDTVAGKALGTCLSALFEDSFLDYVERYPDCTLGEAVDFVKKDVAQTSEQTVSEFGDTSLRRMRVSEFFGEGTSTRSHKGTSVVPYSEVPTYVAKWRAIRARDQDSVVAMEEYQQEINRMARIEIEVMRLGTRLMNENRVAQAFISSPASYSPSCVKEISLAYVSVCKHTIPLPAVAINIVKMICQSETAIPSIDYHEVCIFLVICWDQFYFQFIPSHTMSYNILPSLYTPLGVHTKPDHLPKPHISLLWNLVIKE